MAGLYASEIASIEMLGSNEPIHWQFTQEAMVLNTPRTQPCRDAFVYKIRLKKPFQRLDLLFAPSVTRADE